MSARTDLVAVLTDALDPAVFRVVGSPSCPDHIDPDRFDVRAWATRYEPGPTDGAVQITLAVWVLTGRQEPGPTDDALDDARDQVFASLWSQRWLTGPTADRDVMNDNDGPRWHGWRFECSAFGRILED